jgi:gluconolactonase
MSILELRDDRLAGIVDAGELREVATGFEFTEGAVWDDERGRLIFSDIAGDTMYQLTGDDLAVYRSPSHMGNGNCWDPAGRLVTCEHATSRVVRQEADGTVTVLADGFGGREFNSPNDVIAASDGTVIFTDPTFGRNAFFGVERPLPREERGVYAVRPTGDVVCLADDFAQPNGLFLTADESALFVNDTERRHIRRFAYSPESVSGGEVWAEVTGTGAGDPDGLKTDSAGNVYCTGPGGVHVFAPDAACLGVIRVPQAVANFTWGDADRQTLFFCATNSIYAVRVSIPGP